MQLPKAATKIMEANTAIQAAWIQSGISEFGADFAVVDACKIELKYFYY